MELRLTHTSPEDGSESLIFLGGGMLVCGCPCGREVLCDVQQRLSSKADSARFLNLCVVTVC